jgi:septal ring factor EnvC (AmiA/AmiB activator)
MAKKDQLDGQMLEKCISTPLLNAAAEAFEPRHYMTEEEEEGIRKDNSNLEVKFKKLNEQFSNLTTMLKKTKGEVQDCQGEIIQLKEKNRQLEVDLGKTVHDLALQKVLADNFREVSRQSEIDLESEKEAGERLRNKQMVDKFARNEGRRNSILAFYAFN